MGINEENEYCIGNTLNSRRVFSPTNFFFFCFLFQKIKSNKNNRMHFLFIPRFCYAFSKWQRAYVINISIIRNKYDGYGNTFGKSVGYCLMCLLQGKERERGGNYLLVIIVLILMEIYIRDRVSYCLSTCHRCN